MIEAWNDGAAKAAIVDFADRVVTDVSRNGSKAKGWTVGSIPNDWATVFA